jgi:hypothetical protein
MMTERDIEVRICEIENEIKFSIFLKILVHIDAMLCIHLEPMGERVFVGSMGGARPYRS